MCVLRLSILPAASVEGSREGLVSARRPLGLMRTAWANWRAWREDKSLRALAELDDDHLSSLSEAGQRLRREARWARRASTNHRDDGGQNHRE
jgi:hypothetical protein